MGRPVRHRKYDDLRFGSVIQLVSDVFGFDRADLQRIDYIADALDAGNTESLTPDDIRLWGKWEAAKARGEMRQAESVEKARAEIAEIKSANMAAAAAALEKLRKLADGE